MAGADDPAIVLEQFTNDASNLAPEITHLMEEIEAKDRIVRECEATIKQRDQSLQRHVKVTGGVSTGPFPREDSYVKAVLENYDRALAIQEEKQMLAEKACTLLARHTKRLDALIRELVNNGGLELDDTLSGLLNGTATAAASSLTSSNGTNGRNGVHGAYGANGVSLAHVANGGAAGTAPASTTLANSNLSRLVTQNLGGSSSARSKSPVGTPTSATQARSTREGSTDAKQRRRLNLPAQGSNLRQSSMGPGTPKAGTPQPRDGGGGRAGSVPRGTGRKDKSGPGGNKLLVPPKGGQVNPDSKAAKSRKKKGTRPGKKGGVSDADDSALSNAGDESGSERLSAVGGDLGRAGKDGTGEDRDVDMAGMEEDDEGGDTNLYCTCRSVSYGNMVACDSDDCPYEWFHWNCVGLSKEPPGKWYCEECKTKLGMK